MSFPVTANLDGDRTVDIHLHSFFLGDRNRDCWTYVTRGFTAQGQREMSLSLLVDDDNTGDFPRTPVRMFELLAERTRERKLQPGDATLLGQKGIFGFPSLFCLPAIQFEGLPSLDEHLALILVHQEEYDYAKQMGLTRFLSRLGKFCSSFPYPTWNTQARPSLFPDNNRELSLLADASHIRAERSSVQLSGDDLSMTLHAADLATLQDAMMTVSSGQVLTLCTAFSPDCDASLYWQEGQLETGAYASETRQAGIIGGSFVTLGRSEKSEFSIVEDGFAVSLTDQQWRKLLDALQNQQALSLPLANGELDIYIMLEEPALLARPYEARATWRRLDDEPADAPPLKGQVVLGNVSNLMGNNTLEDNVSKPELQGYLTQVEHTLAEALSEETNSFHFHLDILIEDGQADPTLSSEQPLNPEFVSFIEDLVGRILPCEVWSPIHIRLPFRVNERA